MSRWVAVRFLVPTLDHGVDKVVLLDRWWWMVLRRYVGLWRPLFYLVCMSVAGWGWSCAMRLQPSFEVSVQ